MSAKTDIIRPHLLRSIERLKRLIELNAPAAVIGTEVWMVFRTTLACYGPKAGLVALDQIRDENLRARGICAYNDCINAVDPHGSGICASCEKVLGMDDETLDRLLAPDAPDSHLGAIES